MAVLCQDPIGAKAGLQPVQFKDRLQSREGREDEYWYGLQNPIMPLTFIPSPLPLSLLIQALVLLPSGPKT